MSFGLEEDPVQILHGLLREGAKEDLDKARSMLESEDGPLLARGINDSTGWLALHVASKFRIYNVHGYNHDVGQQREETLKEIISILINLYPQALTTTDNLGNLPIHYSVREHGVELIKLQVEREPSILLHHSNHYLLPIHNSSMRGDRKAVAYQATIGAERLKRSLLNSADAGGNLPVHLAVFYGHAELVKHLIAVDPTFLRLPNKDGDLPIHIATRAGLYRICVILLDGDENASNTRPFSSLESFKANPSVLMCQNTKGQRPIDCYRKERDDIFELLAKKCPRSLHHPDEDKGKLYPVWIKMRTIRSWEATRRFLTPVFDRAYALVGKLQDQVGDLRGQVRDLENQQQSQRQQYQNYHEGKMKQLETHYQLLVSKEAKRNAKQQEALSKSNRELQAQLHELTSSNKALQTKLLEKETELQETVQAQDQRNSQLQAEHTKHQEALRKDNEHLQQKLNVLTVANKKLQQSEQQQATALEKKLKRERESNLKLQQDAKQQQALYKSQLKKEQNGNQKQVAELRKNLVQSVNQKQMLEQQLGQQLELQQAFQDENEWQTLTTERRIKLEEGVAVRSDPKSTLSTRAREIHLLHATGRDLLTKQEELFLQQCMGLRSLTIELKKVITREAGVKKEKHEIAKERDELTKGLLLLKNSEVELQKQLESQHKDIKALQETQESHEQSLRNVEIEHTNAVKVLSAERDDLSGTCKHLTAANDELTEQNQTLQQEVQASQHLAKTNTRLTSELEEARTANQELASERDRLIKEELLWKMEMNQIVDGQFPGSARLELPAIRTQGKVILEITKVNEDGTETSIVAGSRVEAPSLFVHRVATGDSENTASSGGEQKQKATFRGENAAEKRSKRKQPIWVKDGTSKKRAYLLEVKGDGRKKIKMMVLRDGVETEFERLIGTDVECKPRRI